MILLVGAARFELTTPCAQGIGTCHLRTLVSFVSSMWWLRIVYRQEGALVVNFVAVEFLRDSTASNSLRLPALRKFAASSWREQRR